MTIVGVGTFDQPDYELDTGTLYKTSIDNSIAVMARLAAAFAPHQKTPADMTIEIDAGDLWVAGALVTKAMQTATIEAAHLTLPRIDRVVIDAITGIYSVIKGTAGEGPSAPAITSGKLPICQVLVDHGTTAIINSLITDERVGGAGGGSSFASDAEAKAGTVTDKVVAPSQLQFGVPVGVISAFGGAAAPTGYLLCQGQSLLRAGTYADLFAVIGVAYGTPADVDHFTLPNLQQKFPLGKAAAGTGSTLGGTGGAIDHTHTGPSHTHTLAFNTIWVANGGETGPVSTDAGGTGNTGTNNPPYQVVNYIIKY